jgi:hypothetical protein
VADEDLQLVPIIVGQTFLNCTNVTVVIWINQVCLFERKHLAALPEIDETDELWAKETVTIPPHTIGSIAVGGP